MSKRCKIWWGMLLLNLNSIIICSDLTQRRSRLWGICRTKRGISTMPQILISREGFSTSSTAVFITLAKFSALFLPETTRLGWPRLGKRSWLIPKSWCPHFVIRNELSTATKGELMLLAPFNHRRDLSLSELVRMKMNLKLWESMTRSGNRRMNLKRSQE